jgi:hypothetical protein
MTELVLLNENGNLAEDAAAKIMAEIVYPGDADSQRQALLVFADEKQRFMQSGGFPYYRASNLSERVITSLNAEAGQRAVAGYTAIAFALLNSSDPSNPATLYAAANVVRRALNAEKKQNAEPLKTLHLRDGRWEVKGQRCPNTREGIEKAWRKYCSVSHLLAAEAILGEWFPVRTVFERPPEQTITLLKTASTIEPHIRGAAAEREIEVLGVAAQFSGKNSAIEPLSLNNALVQFVHQGLDR